MSGRTQPRSDVADSALSRRIISWRLLGVAVLAGVAAGAVVGVAGAPALSVLVAWSVAAAVVLTRVWRVSWPQDAAGTQRLAEQEGRTRATDTAVLVGCVVSLAAVVVALLRSAEQDAVAVAAVVLGVLVVVLSWALSNTVFALKYARLFYDGVEGGIDFKEDRRRPSYCDFAYLAFTVGMSFAVSDTEPTSTRVRKVALGHALLSYLFGTVVVAVAVNLVTNLGSS
jgi:uncharacterized membrane protein